MKKFSIITNTKVQQEPKVDTKVNEEDLFKVKVLNLMDQLLTIRTYGPVDRYLRAGNIKIEGKELFLEALIDTLSDKSLKDETKVLEGLKSSIKDWELLDEKIDEVNKKIEENKSKNKMTPHRRKLQSLLNNHGDDKELLMTMVKESCKKITDKETSYLRSITAEYMSNEGKYSKTTLLEISNMYKERYAELS